MGQDGGGFWAAELDGLVGRDETLASLRELLDTGGRTAVVTGIAGAGKTAVLTVVARAEAAEGRLVLPITCHESDHGLAFGALVDLLGLGPDSRQVLELVVPDPSRPAAVDPLQLRLAVLGWLEQISESRPTVVVVDDAQWCDDSSLSVLGWVSRRLAGSDVSVLMAARGDAPPAPVRRHPQVALPALTDADCRALLRRAGYRVDALVLPTLIERAAGNPLALLELARAAVGSGLAPSSVETAFREQISRLPAATREALMLAAAGDGDLAVVGRSLSSAPVPAALAAAELADLVAVTGQEVRFRHPLVRSAVLSLATTEERTAAHAVLAAAYEDDVERSAWHQAEAAVLPDEGVAIQLVEASTSALARGASIEAARFMVRASELSPVRADQEHRMLGALMIATTVGDFTWAAETGTRLQRDAKDAAVAVTAGHVAAYALAQTERSAAARRALVRVLEGLIGVDPFAGWSSLTTLAVLTYRSGWAVDDVRRWLEEYERAMAEGTPVQFPEIVAASRAWIRVMIDPLARPRDVLQLLAEAPVPDYPLHLAATHEMLLGATAWLLDEQQSALERLGRSLDLMRQAATPGEMTQTLAALALVQFSAGDYDAVDAAGRLTIDIAEARNQYYAMSDGLELQARVAAIRGEVTRARELCELVLQELPLGEALAVELTVRVSMSWVRLAERDVHGAWDEVRALFEDDGSPSHVHISYRELGHYAASAARVGAYDELERVVAVAVDRLRDAGPYRHLQLARARALLSGEDAEPWHVEAVGTPGAVQWPFELANARLEYGAWLRRRYRLSEARAQLQPALDTFARLGTRAWEELARAELRAAGVSTEAPEASAWASAWASLTGQEREVVRRAASGMTNPEIAAALYLSPRTVSTHLYNAFPKLGVTARAQLRDVVPVAEQHST